MPGTREIGFGSRLHRHATYAANRQTKVYLMMGPMADRASLSAESASASLGLPTNPISSPRLRDLPDDEMREQLRDFLTQQQNTVQGV